MDWDQIIDVIDGQMYAGSAWLGRFSSHQAALEGLQLKRNEIREAKCKSMCEEDHDLLAAIDMDED